MLLCRIKTDHFLVKCLRPLLVGHHTINGDITEEAYNTKEKSGSNVFPSKDAGELIAVLIDQLSFPGQWVLDCSKSNGK